MKSNQGMQALEAPYRYRCPARSDCGASISDSHLLQLAKHERAVMES